MVYTTSSGTRGGDFGGLGFVHNLRVHDVTDSGDYFTSEVDRLSFVVAAVPVNSPAGVQVTMNSQTAGAHGSSDGDVYLAATVSGASSDVTDVVLTFVAGQ